MKEKQIFGYAEVFLFCNWFRFDVGCTTEGNNMGETYGLS